MAIVARHGIGYRDLEEATGLAGTTLRRYAKRFPAFLPVKFVDRAARFQPDAVDVFRRVHALYEAGHRTEEIRAILAEEVPQVHEVATVATIAPPAPDGGWPAVLREVLTAHNALRAELDQERQARAALEQKLLVLEAELIQAKRRSREFERAIEGRLKPAK
ncbi:MAG: MerR family transcriptional regulator [Desulfovibrionaceae bacterium]